MIQNFLYQLMYDGKECLFSTNHCAKVVEYEQFYEQIKLSVYREFVVDKMSITLKVLKSFEYFRPETSL